MSEVRNSPQSQAEAMADRRMTSERLDSLEGIALETDDPYLIECVAEIRRISTALSKLPLRRSYEGEEMNPKPDFQFAVWRRDIERYIGTFPIEGFAKCFVAHCSSYPEHCEIHDLSKREPLKERVRTKYQRAMGLHHHAAPSEPKVRKHGRRMRRIPNWAPA